MRVLKTIAIDFQSNFIEFAKRNKDAVTGTPAEIVDALYLRWLNSPAPLFGDKSPAEYIAAISDPAALVAHLAAGKNEAVVARIAEVAACAPFLSELIFDSDDNELKGICIELLTELGQPEPLEAYISIIKSGGDKDLTELAVERLKENISLAAPLIFDELENLPNDDIRVIFAEILICTKRDERTFSLLSELFSGGGRYALIANYFGKYGDERAAMLLYPALSKVDYADYLEIKNAIERLGGLVDDSLKDFSFDASYQKIKGIKNEDFK